MSQPIGGTLAEIYLSGRATNSLVGTTALRYHPRCYYKPDEPSPTEIWPAIIASVTDLHDNQTGAHRTWLAPDGSGKAPVASPRRAMGELLGHGVRFGVAGEVLAAGEGIETVLSPRQVLPHMPMMAALSAAHLAAILFPATLRRLYVLRDRDPAGDGARDSLVARARSVGIEAIVLSPVLEDFNEDLRWRGIDALVATLGDTRLEPDPDELLWGTVNLFHRAASRVERDLDDNEQAQRRLQREQDGSEVKSVELERLTAEGQTLIERRNSMELFRDVASEAFEHHTGSAWRPRTGSMVNHRNLTAAMIDSRDFLAAKHRAETEVMMPAGPKVALTGGADFNDHRLIWAKLDQVHAKHPGMVLMHGGTPKGAELIASRWADSRKVSQVAFRPDWTKHGKAAPFKRNDAMLDVLPVGVLVFPGTGIQENLADKARKLGIPVMKFDGGA